MMLKRFLLIVTILILSLPSLAVVNMRNGSYNEKWVDFIEPNQGVDLRIERYYSSRSLFPGLFGFGWCSEYETRLVITSDGILNLVECGGGLEVTYYPEKFEKGGSEKTIQKIIADYKTKNKNMSSGDVTNLRTQLKSNTKMRFEYANKLNLIDGAEIRKSKNSFFSKTKGFEKITFDGQLYRRNRKDGSFQIFNRSGQLVQIGKTSGLSLLINYKNNKISSIVDKPKGRRLQLTYGNNGHLFKVSNGQGLTAQYTFEGENLVEVKNMWSKTYKFSYDTHHNMTRVDFPDKTSMRMTYNIANDWIASYTNRKGCREEFNFILSEDDPQNHYKGTFNRKCPKQAKTKGYHEFWYRNYTYSRDKYLYHVYETYQKNLKDVYFHPYLGQPVSIKENNLYLSFVYLLNGLINKREQKLFTKQNEIFKWDKTSFTYERKSFRVASTQQVFLNKLGQKTNSRNLVYSYDPKGRLSKVTDEKRNFLKVSYDSNGNIDILENNKKEKVQLTYKVGVEKPVEVEHLKKGKVLLTYDAQGNVEKVEAAGGRGLATSIVEKFLEMIQFLGPMGENLKI